MEWLKDKKNLPIVIGMAVFVLLAAGGLVAFESGAFNSAPPPPPLSSASAPFGGRGSGGPGMPPGAQMASSSPSGMMPPSGSANMAPSMPGGQTAAAAGAAKPGVTKPIVPEVINPAKGPDPFNIPNGHKKFIQMANGETSGVKPALRDILPVFNLFNIQPPPPPPPPDVPGTAQSLTSQIVVSGIVNAADGIYAILAVNGQSQTVKPGDSLLDGSKVLSIQPTTVTIRTGGGATVSVPLTSGSNQDQNGPDNGGQQQYNGQQQQYNGQQGQPFNGQQGQPFNGQQGQPFNNG